MKCTPSGCEHPTLHPHFNHISLAATLDTLNVYLTWVPLGYIFESNLVELLLQVLGEVWGWCGGDRCVSV